MRLAVAACGTIAVVLLGTGCAAVRNLAAPTCTAGRVDVLVLVAQAVPTAENIPCIRGYPAGWGLGTVEVRNGLASFKLDSDRAGVSALHVRLQRSCDISGATEVPTDEPGTVRYERILSVEGGFRAVRTYQFKGGCVTYSFKFSERAQALVNEASVAVGFVSRQELDARVRAESHGRVHL